MKIEPYLSLDIARAAGEPAPQPSLPMPVAASPNAQDAQASAVPDSEAAAAGGGFSLRRLIGDIDIRHVSPRQMAEASLDLYVAGILPWDEYAMLAFQAELHPDYNKTIGALTGEPAQPDRPRDFLAMWEERLAFDEKYNADSPQLVERTRRIVSVFHQIDAPTDVVV